MRAKRKPTGAARAPRSQRGGGPLGRERHVLALSVLILMLLAVGVRLVDLQVFSASAFAEMARDQSTSEIAIPPQRGTIYDRDGEVLAISREASTIYASPRLITEATATAQALASVLGGDAAFYADRLSRDSGFAYVARKVDPDLAGAVEALELVGIDTMRDSVRSYPSGPLAAQVLGFVGTDDKGLAGLEQHFDSTLRGVAGSVRFEHDRSGRPAPGGVILRSEPVDGTDIVLTIDRDIQHVAQESLERAIETWDAKAGSVVVMDPRSGEILAMASAPGFDPNRFAEADSAAYRNRAVTDVHEPGSTLKSLTTAAVLDAGLFEPDSVFDLPPSLQVAGRRIGEARPRERVQWTLEEILANSSNVGTVRLGMALGEERLYEYLRAFGVTEPTGVDFPGEAQGFLPPVDQWSATSIANIPFGQGVSMTPLQLARAMAAIANG
ncbi:MAG TPA: penicillin-binding protein 2, partial [Coriobacteriia bacterium]|nr:penicillin-binding protein 2 [Coriobacteriia bacterium]